MIHTCTTVTSSGILQTIVTVDVRHARYNRGILVIWLVDLEGGPLFVVIQQTKACFIALLIK